MSFDANFVELVLVFAAQRVFCALVGDFGFASGVVLGEKGSNIVSLLSTNVLEL